MKNNKYFQYIVMGIFIFCILVGAILFATYRSSSTADSQPITIAIWGTLNSTNFNIFASKYFYDTKLKYTVDYTEKDPAVFDADLVEALASGNGPDAIILSQDLILRYKNKAYLIPTTVLPELQFKTDYIQEAELYLSNEGIIALPFSVDPLVMYWNRDIFNNVGVVKPPTTWLEISNLVSKMTKKDSAQNITRSTTALGEFRNVNNAKEILSALFLQAGNSIVQVDPTNGSYRSVLMGSLENSPSILALQYYTNFSNPSKREYSWNRSLANSLDVFANGDLAVYFGFASEFARIKEKNPNLNFDVTFLPQVADAKINSTFGRMLAFSIMKNTASLINTYTVISALTSSAAYPYWASSFNIPSARRDILGQTDKSAAKTIFNQSALISKGWLDPNSTETSTIFKNMVESYTTGRESISSAVGTASDLINNLLK